MKSHPDSLLLRPVRSGMMQDEEVDPLLTEDRLYNQEDLGGEKKNAELLLHRVKNSFFKWRKFIAFWLFGCCTNIPFVLMLNSAYDILDNLEENVQQSEPYELYNDSSCVPYFIDNTTEYYTPRHCLAHGTYQILLANILPTLVIKGTVPYFMHHIPYWVRAVTTIIFSATSILLVALGTDLLTIITGVVFASISSGLGEITFLALSTRYKDFRITLTGWSSGTGASGLVGGLIYTGLTTFLSPCNTILFHLIVPLIFLISYTFILPKTDDTDNKEQPKHSDTTKSSHIITLHSIKLRLISGFQSTFDLNRFRLLPKLFFQYMIWLFIVYVAEYSINQSLYESLYYPNTAIGGYCLNQSVQYKWYQVTYQIGVFLSRSSIALFHIKYFHPLSFLQVLNFFLLFMEVIYQVVPSFWIILMAVLYEGVLGGSVYANAFYFISAETESSYREFAMGVVSVADCVGISAAGFLSYFVHNYICSLGY